MNSSVDGSGPMAADSASREILVPSSAKQPRDSNVPCEPCSATSNA